MTSRILRQSLFLLSALAPVALCAAGALAFSDADVPTAWQLIDDGHPDAGRSFLYHDTQRDRVFLVQTNGDLDPMSVWELVADRWTRRFPQGAQPIETLGCGTYDGSRGVFVITGAENDEIWEFDGESWTLRVFDSTPAPRGFCHMTYDPVSQHIVYYGGSGYSETGQLKFYNDTWIYDGESWVDASTPLRPSLRDQAAMAFDPLRGVVVLFGGQRTLETGQVIVYDDLWEWDGLVWQKAQPAGPRPAARRSAHMVWDPLIAKTVIYGGLLPGSAAFYDDMWAWNGTAWENITPPAPRPSPRWEFWLAWVSSRNAILGYGGFTGESSLNDTWEHFNGAWREIAPVEGIQPRWNHGMAFDEVADKLIVVGGQAGGFDYFEDTWTWSPGAGWSLDDRAGRPSSNLYLRLAFEPFRGEIIGHGGKDGESSITNGDTHHYSSTGSSWLSENLPGPSARTRQGLCFASFLGGSVVFGGRERRPDGLFSDANDTWIYESGAWTEIVPLQRPSKRLYVSLACDSVRDVIWMYGGHRIDASPSQLGDFWSFDGATWTLISGSNPPGLRVQPALAFDVARSRVILYGASTTGQEGVTWEWDGASWHARPTPFQPETSRKEMSLVYDPLREVTYLFSGTPAGASIAYGDLWAYGPDPDTDGIVGKLDNCVTLANPDQANLDGDPRGDGCDCDTSDASVFAVPDAVSGVTVLTDKQALRWESAAPESGSSTVHDVVRGDFGSWPSGAAATVCVARDVPDDEVSLTEVPAPGAGFWYLVRGRNVCGAGSWGTASSGDPRTASACD